MAKLARPAVAGDIRFRGISLTKLGTSVGFRLNLQSAYDLSRAPDENGAAIERDVHPRSRLTA
jgi:plasmid maintenance system antidote protein VapI